MARLSTGFIIAGAYADKVRRTLFAQTRSNGVPSSEVVRASAELNRILFRVIVEKLGIDKGDVVRVRIDYNIEDGRVKWNYETLQIEAFRRIPDENVRKAVEEALKEGTSAEASKPDTTKEESVVKEVSETQYSLEKVGVNAGGEDVYMIKDERRETVGVLSLRSSDNKLSYKLVGVDLGEKPFYADGEITGEHDPKRLLLELLKNAERKAVSREEARERIKGILKGIL